MTRTTFALAAALLCGSSVHAEERVPLQADIDRCTFRMQSSGHGTSLQGSIRLELLVRKDGKVYAAFVRAEHGIDDRQLEGCIVNVSMLWQVAQSALDYSWPYPISFVPAADESTTWRQSWQGAPSAFLPDFNRPPGAEPLNLRAAQGTLDVAEWATTAEHGIAELAVRRYPQAISTLRAALAADRSDPVALRGLAQALAESGGDLKEARALADQLIAAIPASEPGHEALLRVCLAARDDLCAFQQFKLANQAKDLSLRWLVLRDELQPEVEQAAGRLRQKTAVAAKDQQEQQQPSSGDPCAQEKGEDQQALCVVKRCVEEGTIAYARQLSQQNRTEYELGEWRTKQVAPGKLLVTRPIEPKDRAAGGGHDAIWLVKLGDQLVMQPSSAEARQITLSHNRCAARASR